MKKWYSNLTKSLVENNHLTFYNLISVKDNIDFNNFIFYGANVTDNDSLKDYISFLKELKSDFKAVPNSFCFNRDPKINASSNN